jgi:hypothetical protein
MTAPVAMNPRPDEPGRRFPVPRSWPRSPAGQPGEIFTTGAASQANGDYSITTN